MFERQNKMCRLLLKLENEISKIAKDTVPTFESGQLPCIGTKEELDNFEMQLGGADRASLVS